MTCSAWERNSAFPHQFWDAAPSKEVGNLFNPEAIIMSIFSKRPNWRGFCSDVLKTALSQGRHGTVKKRMPSGSPVMKWHNLDEKDRREIKRILQ